MNEQLRHLMDWTERRRKVFLKRPRPNTDEKDPILYLLEMFQKEITLASKIPQEGDLSDEQPPTTD